MRRPNKPEDLSDLMRERRDKMDANAKRELNNPDTITMMNELTRHWVEQNPPDGAAVRFRFGGIVNGEEQHFEVTLRRTQ